MTVGLKMVVPDWDYGTAGAPLCAWRASKQSKQASYADKKTDEIKHATNAPCTLWRESTGAKRHSNLVWLSTYRIELCRSCPRAPDGTAHSRFSFCRSSS